MVDVLLGLDWQSGLRDWYSRASGHGHLDNLNVAAFLHAPLPSTTPRHPIAPISEPSATSTSNTMFPLSRSTHSLPGDTPLGQAIPPAPAPSFSSISSYSVIPNRYINDASGHHSLAYEHGTGSLFVGHENVTEFFHILEVTDSAIGGSSLPLILAPPIDDIDDWIPNNLNIFVPVDQPDVWGESFARIHLHPNHSQPRIARPYRTVTKSHVKYASRLKNKPIMITEGIDKCVITPATAAATTIGMCVATCSTICVLYPDLVDKRRALKSWYMPTIKSCIDLETRGYRRSISTMGWSESCGWNCPAVWRRIQGLRGVGIFCWGGYNAEMKDGGSVGFPYTDVSMKWRLGDTCSNVHCPWFKYQEVSGAVRF
ncbi:hypothetical protein DFH07DRAFT_1031660 [Mycena maculata]|uniref:Uncharacterized protein n=1 Tax=Mycena maculata TaxID=230809 RepID=A0AAD7IXC5_9AGAR|nr:hypothetical protein DFH07DRAFT_1031660 [Mycena maculata]